MGHFLLDNMKIINFFRQNNINLSGEKLLVAASGGPDSMALLDMLEKLRKKRNFELVAAHFNHQLRSDSEEESQILRRYCQKYDIPLFIKKWVKKEQPKTGIEAAARTARYAFLTQIAKENDIHYLLTAHHGDDLVENILLKFIRSGNPEEMDSLQAVGKMHGIMLLRPLLAYSKQELLDYDKRLGIDFVVDYTNQEDGALRNRLRHHVVPLLKQENPNLIKNALFFSEKMGNLTNFVDNRVNSIGSVTSFLGQAYRIKSMKLINLNEKEKNIFWQKVIWQKFHRRVNQNLGNFIVDQYQNYFYLYQNQTIKKVQPFEIQPDHSFSFQNRQFVVSTKKPNSRVIGDFWLEAGTKLMAGSLEAGSKLLLQNGQHVKAKKKFAESAIPSHLRPLCLTIYAEDHPVFVEKTYKNQDWIKNGQHYFVYI